MSKIGIFQEQKRKFWQIWANRKLTTLPFWALVNFKFADLVSEIISDVYKFMLVARFGKKRILLKKAVTYFHPRRQEAQKRSQKRLLISHIVAKRRIFHFFFFTTFFFLPNILCGIPSLTREFTTMRIIYWRMKDWNAQVSVLEEKNYIESISNFFRWMVFLLFSWWEQNKNITQ